MGGSIVIFAIFVLWSLILLRIRELLYVNWSLLAYRTTPYLNTYGLFNIVFETELLFYVFILRFLFSFSILELNASLSFQKKKNERKKTRTEFR